MTVYNIILIYYLFYLIYQAKKYKNIQNQRGVNSGGWKGE